MSNKFASINRLMGDRYEIDRQRQFRKRKWDKKKQQKIQDALDRLENDFDDEDERAKNRSDYVDGAIEAFDEELTTDEQIRFDAKYLNGEREETYVMYVHIGTVRKRNGNKVYLYGTIVEGATRAVTGTERNEKNEHGVKKKYYANAE